MAAKGRKVHRDTVEGQRKAALDADLVIDPPPNVKLDGSEERRLWDQVISARPPDAWREYELVMVGKIVKLETRIRHLWDLADQEGYIEETPHGRTPNKNVVLADTLQKQQMSIIRSLSLGTRGNDAIAINNGGRRAKARKKDEKPNVLSMIVNG